MSSLRVTVVLVVCACLLAAGRAPADEVPSRKAEARQHYAAGLRFYNVSEYVQALAEFKEAYLAYDDPAFLYNIAQCHRRLGNRADAITYYTRYLRARPDAPEQGEVKKMIAELKAAAEAAEAMTPVGDEPRLAAPPVTAAPAATEPPLPVAAPPPPSTGAAAEAPAPAPSLSLPAAPPPPLAVAAAPAPANSDAQAVARARYRAAALTVAAVGLASAGLGGALWLSANSTYNDCQNKGGCLRSQEPRGEDTAGVVLFWGGSALAVVGGTAFVLLRAKHPGALAWLDHLAVDPGRGVSLRGSF